MTSERIKAVGESTPPLSIGFDIAIAMCRRADVLGHPYPSPELRVWLANQITIAVNAARSSSPIPDGVIKERGEDKEAERALRDGLSQVEPASGLNPSDFDPSRGAAEISSDIHMALVSVFYHPEDNAGCWRAAEAVHDALVAGGHLRARDQRAEREDGASRPRPEAASPVRNAEAPASLVQPPSSQESGVGETEEQAFEDAVARMYAEQERRSKDTVGVVVKVPEDWALVPREPTQAMWAAFRNADPTGITFDRAYRAMIEATPRPSQREG